MTRDCRGHRNCVIMFFANVTRLADRGVAGEEWLVRAHSSASAGRRFGHNDKQRARAETRGRSRELIAGGRHERQIVLALANDRMFLAAATVGCRPSACHLKTGSASRPPLAPPPRGPFQRAGCCPNFMT